MGKTKIEWTASADGTPGATWNPVRGCDKISPGCKNCYAETFAERWRGVPGHPYEQGFDLRLVPEKLAEPLRWRKPRKVFVNSMSDLFHEDVPSEYIAAVFGVMAATPRHTFQVLTKRSERMRAWFEWYEGTSGAGASPIAAAYAARDLTGVFPVDAAADQPWPLPNVWLGVSVEDQARAEERIPDLLAATAAVRFVSAEPLLGPLDLEQWLWPTCMATREEHDRDHGGGMWCDERWLDWVIVGGESGPKSRPFYAGWARRLVEQCREAGVACFVKQLGAKPYDRNDAGFEGEDLDNWPMDTDARDVPGDTGYQGAPVLVKLRSSKGGDPSEWPEDLRVREWPTT